MKNFFWMNCLLLGSFSAHADWKQETVAGLATYIYTPKITTSLQVSSGKRALMVNLHGCAQKAEDLKADGNWVTTADEYDMVVVLPRVPNGGMYMGCWDYYGPDHTVDNRNNAPIIQLVKNLLARPELNIDPGQVYVSGLSSGGGESMVLGCLAPDLFAGMGLNAGPSVGTTVNQISSPPASYTSLIEVCKKLAGNKTDFLKTQLTSIIYGSNDSVVKPVHNTNNSEIMKVIYGADQKSSFDTKQLEGTSTDGQGTLFSDAKGPRISLIMNSNLGHNWPAGGQVAKGLPGGGNFINKKSINYPAYLAKFFFTNNRRSALVRLPELQISPIAVTESRFIVSGRTTLPYQLIRDIDVTVHRSQDGSTVDSFKVFVARDGGFEGYSKLIDDGEYFFTVKLTNVWGLSRSFYRNAWSGPLAFEEKPQLVNVKFETKNDCIKLVGQAVNNGATPVKEIHFSLDNNALGSTPVAQTTQWTYEACGINNGAHSLRVWAVNERGTESNSAEYSFQIGLRTITSTLQEHMMQGRLKWEDYGQWFAKYGSKPFALSMDNSGEWREL